jgi:hypothetical protein
MHPAFDQDNSPRFESLSLAHDARSELPIGKSNLTCKAHNSGSAAKYLLPRLFAWCVSLQICALLNHFSADLPDELRKLTSLKTKIHGLESGRAWASPSFTNLLCTKFPTFPSRKISAPDHTIRLPGGAIKRVESCVLSGFSPTASCIRIEHSPGEIGAAGISRGKSMVKAKILLDGQLITFYNIDRTNRMVYWAFGIADGG